MSTYNWEFSKSISIESSWDPKDCNRYDNSWLSISHYHFLFIKQFLRKTSLAEKNYEKNMQMKNIIFFFLFKRRKTIFFSENLKPHHLDEILETNLILVFQKILLSYLVRLWKQMIKVKGYNIWRIPKCVDLTFTLNMSLWLLSMKGRAGERVK